MTHACSTAGGSTPITLAQWDSSWPAFVHEPQRRAVLGYFTARFGIPLTAFEGLGVLLHHKTYSVVSAMPALERLARLQVHTAGLPVLRHVQNHLKPTTAALQRFGMQATTHLIDLSDDQCAVLLRTREQSLTLPIQPGYVILRHAGVVLGCGLYTPGCLRSQLPKHILPRSK